MIALTIGNSTSQITGLTVGQFKELSNLLSYEVDAQSAYFSGSYNRKRSLLSKRGEFPTGLLYLVSGWLSSAYAYALKDLRKRPEPLESTFNLSLRVTPYSEQLSVLKAISERPRGIITAPTGSGKSILIALIISQLKVPTLVVVPTLALKHQLGEFLKESFGSKAPIIVQNVDALDPKVELKHIGAVIIDEFHHSAAKGYRDLNKKAWKNVYYRYGLTATPFRSNDNERLLLESVLSEVIYEISYKTAIDKKFIVPVEAYVYTLPKTQMKGNPKDYKTVYSELIVNNTNRNNKIAEVLRNLAGTPTLCLVKEIKHGEILADLTGLPFANGQDGNSQELIHKFNSGEITGLIGTSGVLGEGVDSRPAEFVILASTGKAKTQFMQNIGRVLRRYGTKESGKVILFKDSSHKFLLSHYKQYILFLNQEYGVKAVEL